MENFTSQSVKRRIMWHIDYRGHSALPDLERAVTELTVIQRDVQAILPLAMVSGAVTGSVHTCVCRGACVGLACAQLHVRMDQCVWTCGPAPECVTASCTQVCL